MLIEHDDHQREEGSSVMASTPGPSRDEPTLGPDPSGSRDLAPGPGPSREEPALGPDPSGSRDLAPGPGPSREEPAPGPDPSGSRDLAPGPGPARDHEPVPRHEPAPSDPAASPGQLDAAWLDAGLPSPGELTAAEAAALYELDGGWPGPDEDPGYDPAYDDDPGDYDPGRGLPADPDEEGVPEVWEAGFTHRYGGSGAGFTAGGPLDEMLPGPDLAWHLGGARQAGLGALSDDELAGVLGAARRVCSWQAELELAVVAELDARRAGPDGRDGEHVAEEIAAALTLTGRSAGSLLELARRLGRLPQTRSLLAAGIIDRARAAVIADQLAILDDAAAAAAEDRVAPRAGAMTTGQLAAACQRAVLAYDPQAAARRKQRAEREARVECWAEPSGTGSIAGRDLNLAGVIAADKHLDAAARWLQGRGAAGTMDQLRARVFVARLAGQPLESLLPAPGPAAAAGCDDPPGGPGSPIPGSGPPGGAIFGGLPGGSAPGSGLPASPIPGSDRPGDPVLGSGPPGGAISGALPGSGPDPAAPDSPWPAGPGGLGALGGSVNLVLPATTWLGLTDTPGQAGRYGAIDADTGRDLANALAAYPATRWCLTLTDRNGRAVAHGCARAGPGPPGTTNPAAWLAQITITTLETGTCAHPRQTPAYRPPDSLRHLIKIRSPRCGYPGCRRPATRCDDDHTIPHHQGGKTCECNLHPLCRRHHQAKQAPGWRLEQPEPGLLTWTTPSGRRYATAAEPYPA
jgi:hypothetical protein